VKANPEHEEDHADFGQLLRETGVCDESWRERAYDNACNEVSNKRRQAKPRGNQAEKEGQADAGGYCCDEGGVVMHGSTGGALVLTQ
jgi:hypothetical protein